MAKLSNTVNPYNFAVDWDGIRDSVLDMATYCCSAMATKRCMHWPRIGFVCVGTTALVEGKRRRAQAHGVDVNEQI
jgi:hypothetical protein